MEFKKREASEEIPTSSMADIAFLLIIYFMITTTFAATRGLDWALPQDDENTPQVEKEEAVLIEIHRGGELIVDGNPMKKEDIMDYLLPKLERNPKKPVIIRPDEDAQYGYMVGVFDELRQGEDREGIKINISIPTRREIEMFWY
jgi:biopolymer transport protein ExbD